MNKHGMTVAALAVATFGWISIAAAQPPEGGARRPGGPGGPGLGGPRGPAPIERIAERLGMTDEQKSQWKAIHERARETGEPLMRADRAAHEAFDKALNADTADPNAVGQAAIAMRNAGRKLEAHRKATMDETKAILTPEQAAKVEEMEQRGPGPGGPGRPGPGGPEGPGGRRRPGPGTK